MSLASVLLCSAVAASLLWRPPPLLLWNPSPSSAIGLYAVTSPARVRVGDMAIAWPPPGARRLAATRLYLPSGVPLVKRIAAVSGDYVCARGERISVNGRRLAMRRMRDPSGRRMPWWSGCIRLSRDELFLLSPVGPLAFDGRYFGVTRRRELVGAAILLWAWPADGLGGG